MGTINRQMPLSHAWCHLRRWESGSTSCSIGVAHATTSYRSIQPKVIFNLEDTLWEWRAVGVLEGGNALLCSSMKREGEGSLWLAEWTSEMVTQRPAMRRGCWHCMETWKGTQLLLTLISRRPPSSRHTLNRRPSCLSICSSLRASGTVSV